MAEIDLVGVVKAQPLSLSRRGKAAIKEHLRRLGWRFAWLLLFQRLVQGVGYELSLAFASYFRQHLFYCIRDVLGLIAFRGTRR